MQIGKGRTGVERIWLKRIYVCFWLNINIRKLFLFVAAVLLLTIFRVVSITLQCLFD